MAATNSPYPLVSVIIPAYNAERFIVDTLDSVFSQTYKNLEIIVVDDGSNDSTYKLINDIYHDNIILLKQPNSGPSAARNKGIEVSTGKYIAFLDADDLWFPEKIRKQVELMELNPDVGMVFGNAFTLYDNIKNRISHFEEEALDLQYFGDHLYFKDAFKKLIEKNIIMTQTVMLRSSILKQSGIFDSDFRFGEDFLLWLKIADISKIAYQPQALSFRRRHSANLTNDPEKPICNRPKLYQKMKETYGDQLRVAGIDIQQKISNAWFQLGHFKLFNKREKEVLFYFSESFKNKPTFFNIFYITLSFLRLSRFALIIKDIRDRYFTSSS